MKRPIGITIIATLFVSAGLWAGFEIINGLFNNRLSLNLGVLMAPVGFGLMKGRSSSRGWAKFWIGSSSFLIGGVLVFYPFVGDSWTVSWLGKPVTGTEREFLAFGFPIAFLLMARWMWKCLVSKETAPFFDDFCQPNAEAVPPNRSLPSTLNSTSPVRGLED